MTTDNSLRTRLIAALKSGYHQPFNLVSSPEDTIDITSVHNTPEYAEMRMDQRDRYASLWSDKNVLKLTFYEKLGDGKSEELGCVCNISTNWLRMVELLNDFLDDTPDPAPSMFEDPPRYTKFGMLKMIINEPKPKPYIPRHLRNAPGIT